MNLTIEQMREIVDGAHEGCDAYETDTHVFDLDELRAAIADHNKCQHEWNETTSNSDKYRFFVCKHCDSTRNFIPLNEDITDCVSDIRNHIAPTTKVIDK